MKVGMGIGMLLHVAGALAAMPHTATQPPAEVNRELGKTRAARRNALRRIRSGRKS
jgi:hypothetical protein